MELWNHQKRGIKEVIDSIYADKRRVVVASPTGGGKTEIMMALIRYFLEREKRASLYTNRKLLIEQTTDRLNAAGLYHGVRSAGYDENHDHPLQISSIQTEHSRVVKRKQWELHKANIVLVDEGHLQTGDTAQAIYKMHHDAGAAVVLFTATPIDMESVADHLIIAGTNSELRNCGALVPAVQYGPDEPDLKSFRKLQAKLDAGDNLSEKDAALAMMTPNLFGRVWEWFEKLNPEHKPTLLFAPGVQESIWFAEKFQEKGVKAAHIDGEDIWIDGELHPTSPDLRRQVLDDSKAGRIKVLCNRFVLREGIDCPWLSHGIFATIFGSLQSYLQSGGRLLRYHHSLESVTIQDHGGNWWRHGSLNADREWSLDLTASMAVGLRAERLRDKKMAEPFRCPSCGKIWVAVRECTCGFVLHNVKKSRPVVTTEGRMVEMTGDIYMPRRISRKPNGQQLWAQMYFRSLKGKGIKTFRAARALFAYENDWGWPDPTWPFMPTQEKDWFKLVPDVPRERLT